MWTAVSPACGRSFSAAARTRPGAFSLSTTRCCPGEAGQQQRMLPIAQLFGQGTLGDRSEAMVLRGSCRHGSMDSKLAIFDRAFDVHAECPWSGYSSKRNLQPGVVEPGASAEYDLSVGAAGHDLDGTVFERCGEQHVSQRIQAGFLI